MANVKVGANTGEFQKQMKAMVTQLKEINSEFTLSATKAKLYGSEQDKLKVKQQELTSKVKLQNDQIKLQSNYIKKLTDDLVKNRSKNMELHDSIDKVNNKLQESIKNTSKDSEESKALAKQLEELKKQLNSNEKQFDATNNKLDTNKTKLNNMKTALLENEDALKKVDKQLSTIKLDEFAKKADNLSAKLNSFGNAMTTKVTLPLLGAGIASFNMASDMDESLNKVEVACGSGADEVKNFSDTTLEKFGVAKGTALDMMATFSDMGTGMGLESEEANKMSMSLTGLAADLSSFKNIRIDVAKTALNSIYTGETESLKQLGIVMTQANLEAYAVESGFLKVDKSSLKYREATLQLEKAQAKLNDTISKKGKNSKEAKEATLQLEKAQKKLAESSSKGMKDLSQAEQVQLRYNYVMEQTKNAQGDFARTSDGAANQQRIFTESLKQLGATMGQNLLPTITPFIKKLNEIVKKFGALDKNTQKNIVKFGAFAAALGPVTKVFGTFTSTLGKSADGISKFIDVMKGDKVKAFGNAIKKLGTGFLNAGKSAITLAGNIGKTLVSRVVSGAKAIGNMTLTLGKMTIEFIKSSAEVAKNVIAWGAHKIAVIASTAATKAMELAQAALNFVMSMNPIAKVVLIIGSLVAAFVTAYNKCDWFREGVDNSMQKIKNAMQSLKEKWDYVMDKISSAWEWLKSKFKLPHFSIEGSFSLNPPSIPRIGVDWYWSGGIIDTPTVLGNIGVGDRFEGTGNNAEAIIPLDSMYRNIDSIVAKRVEKAKQVIYVLVDNTIDVNGKVIKAISKETVPRIKKSLSKEQENKKIGKGIAVYV